MDKQNKIFIKILLEKDESTGNLLMKTWFDQNAPNFYQQNNEISWCPTPAEIQFIYEAFEMMPNQRLRPEPVVHHQPPPAKEEPVEEYHHPTEKEEEVVIQRPKTVEKPQPRIIEAPPMRKSENGVVITSDVSTVDEIIKRKKNADGVMVEADEDTIVDRVLKHKKKNNW